MKKTDRYSYYTTMYVVSWALIYVSGVLVNILLNKLFDVPTDDEFEKLGWQFTALITAGVFTFIEIGNDIIERLERKK